MHFPVPLRLCCHLLLHAAYADLFLNRSPDLFSADKASIGRSAYDESNRTFHALRGYASPVPVHVVYSSDARTFSALLVSMLSLARSLSAPSDCTIHLIVAEADLPAAQHLVKCFHVELEQGKPRRLSRNNAPVVLFHKMNSAHGAAAAAGTNATTTKAPAWVQRFWQTPAAYARLHLTEYLPEDVVRVLWLDTDTVVKGDIASLMQRPMSHPIAAVYDKKSFATTYSEWVADANDFLPANFSQKEHFFNSGVLVVNLGMWRAENILHRLEETARKIPGVEDQFLLNMVFYHRFDVLNGEWNFLGLGEPSAWWHGQPRPSAKEIEAAKVLHFTGVCKPAADSKAGESGCTSYYEYLYHEYRPHQTCIHA